jgi:NADH dehydrogenase
VAELAIAAGEGSANLLQDARGAEIYTFDELVRAIARQTGSKSRIVHLPVRAALWLSQIVGLLVRDVVLTHDELAGLMAGLLVSKQPPTGSTAFSTWLAENAAQLGQSYAPELERHYRSMP